ncbi:MAG: methyltransferase domain-containing protein, partial [Anaerolineales bacterium]|nr:methyltransferase domain-containing protein [Anaerolineales bacterium]
LDLHTGLLNKAEGIVASRNLSDRIRFKHGSVNDLPFDDDVFDWAWSADCIGYPTGEPLPVLKELMRVVKPGGIIAILAMSSQSLLPGHPLLEARLNATCLAYAHLLEGRQPESHFMRLLHWFRIVSLLDSACCTFTGNIQAPLDEELVGALVSLFEMLWGVRQSGTSDADWDDYQRLCRPESADFILKLNDYAGFITYTMFRGTVPG